MDSNHSSEMHIALCVDNNYLPYCCTAIESIISNHNSGSKIIFYILHFSDVDGVKIIIDHINKAGYRGVDIEVSSSKVCNFQTHSHFSSSVYLRLLLPRVLPSSLERVLYLDSDLIVLSDLSDLYNTNLTNFTTAMVLELSLDESMRCDFNTGVMLMDLKSWRNNYISEKIMDYIESYDGRLDYVDQSAINLLLREETKQLDIKWNVISAYFKHYEKFKSCDRYKIDDAVINPKIIHFTTSSKPWMYKNEHPYKSEFKSYLRKTPFKAIKEEDKNLKTMLKKCRKRIREIIGNKLNLQLYFQ